MLREAGVRLVEAGHVVVGERLELSRLGGQELCFLEELDARFVVV